MPIRIESAIYNNLPTTFAPTKFETLRYTVSGQADFTVGLVLASAWQWRVVVSASASALGGGVSAGGVDSLRASFAKVSTTGNANQLQFVNEEGATATGYMTLMQVEQQLNPTVYLYRLGMNKIN